MARGAGIGARARRSRPRAFPAREARRKSAPLGRLHSRSTRRPRTSTRFRPRARSARPATPRSSTRSVRSCAGTRWRWCCGRTRNRPSWAATSRASPPRRRSMTSASTISFARGTKASAAISFISRVTRRPAFTRAPISKAASPKSSSITSGRKSAAKACRPIRIRGSCPTSGSFPRCRWGSGRSWRFTRRASCAT